MLLVERIRPDGQRPQVITQMVGQIEGLATNFATVKAEALFQLGRKIRTVAFL